MQNYGKWKMGVAAYGGMSGQYGTTRLVDGHPETGTLGDALLRDGESVVVDVGLQGAERPLSAYFSIANARLGVALYSSDTPRPTISPAPSTEAPTLSPTAAPTRTARGRSR